MSERGPPAAEWAVVYRDLMLALGPMGARYGDQDPDFCRAAEAMDKFHDLLMAAKRAERGD